MAVVTDEVPPGEAGAEGGDDAGPAVVDGARAEVEVGAGGSVMVVVVVELVEAGVRTGATAGVVTTV